MKGYESMMMIQQNNRFQYVKNNKSLEPIMEYDYYFQSMSQHEGKGMRGGNEKVKNNGNREEKANQKVGNQNRMRIKQGEMASKQSNKNNAVSKSQNEQLTKRKNQKSPYNINTSKVTNKTHKNTQSLKPAAQQPLKQPKVLTQHNPIAYSSTLFPQPQSVKQKLKQNLQQQMLSNYYISKYSTIMSKITNENIKIQLPIDMTERSFSNNKDNQSMMGQKKRRNFKEVMRHKGVPLQKSVKMQQNNQFVGKRNNFNELQAKKPFITPLQREQRDDSLNITFSPVKISLMGKNTKREQNLPESNRSHHSHTSSIPHQNGDNQLGNYSSQKRRQHNDSSLQSQHFRQSSHSHSPSRRNFHHHNNQSQPESRLNFKQSLKQKKSLYLQYQQNYDLYKKLQSSIIDQLYSPSPKRIQKEKFNQICFIDRQLTGEERKMLKLKQMSGVRGFYDGGLVDNNIEINQGGQDGVEMRRQEEKANSYLGDREIDLLQQSIRKSIQQSIKSRSQFSSSSPDASHHQKYYPNQQSFSKQSAYKSPSKRSPVSNKYKTKSSQSRSDVERQQRWNSNFYSLNSYNRKYINNVQSPSKKIDSSPQQSPKRCEQRRYYSLEKQAQSPQTLHASSVIKAYQSRSKSKKFSEQKFPINEQQNQFDSDHQDTFQNPTEHSQSYNQISKRLGNEVSVVMDSQKHLLTKIHQRKGSFHSVRSNRNFKQYYQSLDKKFIVGNVQASRNSNETVNEPSEQQEDNDYDGDVEFVPAANENIFSENGSQGQKSKYSSPTTRNNLIETVGQTRSRKASDHFSFISDDYPNHNQLSMLSRFSMTSQQGSIIIHKLENEITQNEFGPYQYALQSIRELLYNYKTAWPIYVVGQRILDDRVEYEKKIQLQGKMMDGYKEKIMELKRKQQEYQNQTDVIKKNKFKILKLVRQLCQSSS